MAMKSGQQILNGASDGTVPLAVVEAAAGRPNRGYTVSTTVGAAAVDEAHAETMAFGGHTSRSISITNDGADTIYVSFDGGVTYMPLLANESQSYELDLASVQLYAANAPAYRMLATYRED